MLFSKQNHVSGNGHHAKQFSKQKLFWRQIGNHQQIERSAVAFGRDRGDSQRVDHHKAHE